MQIEKRDGSKERRILIGLVVNKSVLARIASKWQTGMFKSPWVNIVAQWCVDYYAKYEKPPRKHIETLFEQWAATARDKESIKLVERFLGQVSGEYASLSKETNADYLIDLAAKHLNEVKFQRLAESINEDLEEGNLEKAETRVSQFARIELGESAGIDVMRDKSAMQKALASKQEPLIVYPGAAGNFFQDIFERDAFVALLGAEKKGKTYCLLDIAWRAILQRRKVAFFQVGDLSENQMMRRFMIRAAKRPLFATKKLIRVPNFIEHDPDAQHAKADYEEQKFEGPLNWQQAYKAFSKIIRSRIKSHDSYLKLECHPTQTISIQGIKSILQTWERAEWTPDVVVIDYADILAPLPGSGRELRDRINDNWAAMRAMSQSLHCLVVTATQADAASYSKTLLTRGNFSNDKRILGHVTAMVGLNQTPDEKKAQIMRTNFIVARDNEYSESLCCHFAGCLSLASPWMKSTF